MTQTNCTNWPVSNTTSETNTVITYNISTLLMSLPKVARVYGGGRGECNGWKIKCAYVCVWFLFCFYLEIWTDLCSVTTCKNWDRSKQGSARNMCVCRPSVYKTHWVCVCKLVVFKHTQFICPDPIHPQKLKNIYLLCSWFVAGASNSVFTNNDAHITLESESYQQYISRSPGKKGLEDLLFICYLRSARN